MGSPEDLSISSNPPVTTACPVSVSSPPQEEKMVSPMFPAGSSTTTVPFPAQYPLQVYQQAYLNRARLLSTLAYPTNPYANPFVRFPSFYPPFFGAFDSRFYRVPEEPKPQHSYIGLIAMAILSSPDKKMVLSDIYQWILDHYSYFRTRGPGWRNSIRHNLSLNDCFIKSGRSANGKGHYWAIHPANVEDFKKGDFRRRKAQRKVRKHMGLDVPDDEDSPSPPPQVPSPPCWAGTEILDLHRRHQEALDLHRRPHEALDLHRRPHDVLDLHRRLTPATLIRPLLTVTPKKRQFDVDSLLAPDDDEPQAKKIQIAEEIGPRENPFFQVVQEKPEEMQKMLSSPSEEESARLWEEFMARNRESSPQEDKQ
ncbi:unnamed protein product [Darwinula stevensoni]|uniref:Fork-head domain-containing protein n=1 Tax=Darwinula stevensoni TaxID=69355 RepID=A0A7R9FSY6_9CRUS|nr:unnamed protein product [Darwinula stevensoni]CAG0904488.1 unnamed protein product [Darwinula stevensoni]